MRVQYKESIRAAVDRAILDSKYAHQEIEYIQLNRDEYIQFLEEIGPIGNIILKDPFSNERKYKDVRILVPT